MTAIDREKLRADAIIRFRPGSLVLGAVLEVIDAAPALPAGLPDVERAYTLLVSVIPAVYRSWNQSPNEPAERLNGLLYAKVTEWVTDYQRATGRPVDSYLLAAFEGSATLPSDMP